MRLLWMLMVMLALVPPVAAQRSGLTVNAAARAMQPGEVVVLTVRTPRPDQPVRVTALGHGVPAFQTSPSRWEALLGLDLDVRVGAHVVRVEAGPAAAPLRTTYRIVVKPKRFPTRRLTVAEGYVNPPPDVLDRIAAEAKRLQALWSTSSPVRQWTAPFVRPVADPANSAFGSRSILNGQARSPHGGADFLSPAGTPIHAPNDGTVVLVDNLYYTGNTVVIDHGLGLLSLFAHLSETRVTPGQTVHGGDVLGLVGATGRVTGPHLHWTVRLGGARVDPLSLLAVEGAAPGASATP